MLNSPQTGVSKYVVRELGADDESRWDRFVEAHDRGTFFHLSGWKKLYEDETNHSTHYFYCELGGEIVGILPVVHIKSLLFGNALISLPFLVYGGVVSSDPGAESLLKSITCKMAASLGANYVEFRNRWTSESETLFAARYAGFSKSINQDPEKNLLAIPRKQRAMVRKGINAGLKAEIDDDVNRLYSALLPCKRNLGTPFFNRRFLKKIRDVFGDRVEVLTVTLEGKTVCSVMSFRFRDQILPYYGGGGSVARRVYGNDFMYWSVMERACRDGVRIFDFGRSMIGSGAYGFKKNWGFEPVPLPYEYNLIASRNLPDLNPGNPRFQILIRMWKKLPLPIAGLIGPYIARRIG